MFSLSAMPVHDPHVGAQSVGQAVDESEDSSITAKSTLKEAVDDNSTDLNSASPDSLRADYSESSTIRVPLSRLLGTNCLFDQNFRLSPTISSALKLSEQNRQDINVIIEKLLESVVNAELNRATKVIENRDSFIKIPPALDQWQLHKAELTKEFSSILPESDAVTLSELLSESMLLASEKLQTTLAIQEVPRQESSYDHLEVYYHDDEGRLIASITCPFVNTQTYHHPLLKRFSPILSKFSR